MSFIEDLIHNRAKVAETARAVFFASGDAVPDLDFWPACPVCDVGQMDYDEVWWCVDCGIEWGCDGTNGTVDSSDEAPNAS